MKIDPRVARAGGAEVEAFLSAAAASWRGVLGRNLAGVYVHGSLSTGAFNPRTSDIDVIVATRALTKEAEDRALEEEHAAMLGRDDGHWAARLELAFVPIEALKAQALPGYPVLSVHPDEGFGVVPLGPEFLIQKHMLREHGITILGRDPRRFIVPVSPGELREAQVGILREQWLPQLEFPGRFLGPAYQVYAVLSLCRALCLLTTGEVVTKPQAAAWAMRGPYLSMWRSLVRSAVTYPGGGQLDQRGATLDFVRFVLDEAGIVTEAPSS